MKYKAVIGLEMHCEMKSNAKVFSHGANVFTDIPNSNVSPVDMAFPGTLPTINKECVRKALMASIMLNCKQPEYMYFDRKNYYYPDLPKGYQITQMHDPVGVNGHITIDVDGIDKDVLIHDIHLEEDSASLDHYITTSLINYNRAGVPLLELVTEPCFNNAHEAVLFIEHMIRMYRYADISDADTKRGQVRCDVNVSIMDEDATELGTKVEIKNVNSLANIEAAINYEIERQSKLKDEERYNEVEQETRRFDEESGTTIRMRSKVDAIDYKYFVEPNIPKYKIDKSWLEEIKKDIPMMPRERKLLYINEYGLSEYDASIIIKEKDYADYFEECIRLGMNTKNSANYLITNIIAYINANGITLKEFYLKPILLKQIFDELDKGNISSKQAKEIFNKSLEENKEPKTYITSDNAQISDSNILESIIDNILSNNKAQIDEYHNGKTNLFAFFVGQVMKETKGKANPKLVTDILKSKLDS